MALNFGSATPSAYYLGSNTVTTIYFGDTKVWPIGVTGQVVYVDFDVSASFLSGSSTINNIGTSKDYNVNNVQTMSIFAPLAVGTNRYDPSGSGRVLLFSASNPGPLPYQLLSNFDAKQWLAPTSSEFSFEAWVRPYQKPNIIVGNQFLSGPNSNPIFNMFPSWFMGISSLKTNDGAMILYQRTTSPLYPIAKTAANVIDWNQWNHLVYTFKRNVSSTSITMYKNGVSQSLVTNDFTSVVLDNTSLTPGLGRGGHSGSTGDNIAGGFYDLSTFAGYNKVLSAADVQTLYDSTKARYGFIPYTSSSIVIDPATYTGGGLVYNTGLATTPVTGTLNGSVQYTSSVAGGVFNFTRPNINNPNTNYIAFNSYNFGNEATFMAWLYPKGQLAGGSVQTFLANTTNWSESNGFKLTWDPLFATANSMGFENGNGSTGTGNATSTSSIVDNQWQHMTWTYNKNTSVINMYRNGVLLPSSSNYTVNAFNTNGGFLIGSMYERNPPFGANYEFQMNAMLGVVKITDSVLPTATILADFFATRGRYGV